MIFELDSFSWDVTAKLSRPVFREFLVYSNQINAKSQLSKFVTLFLLLIANVYVHLALLPNSNKWRRIIKIKRN